MPRSSDPLPAQWNWPAPLYEHGGGRELSTKQWDTYKLPVIEVVPAEWLGLASGNQDGEAFMRAYGRRQRGESDPDGAVPCVMCGFPCEGDQTIFAVPREFARARLLPPGGQMAAAHVACSHSMYRGRFQALRRWVEEGLPHEEILRRLALWPWESEEEKAEAAETERRFDEYLEARRRG